MYLRTLSLQPAIVAISLFPPLYAASPSNTQSFYIGSESDEVRSEYCSSAESMSTGGGESRSRSGGGKGTASRRSNGGAGRARQSRSANRPEKQSVKLPGKASEIVNLEDRQQDDDTLAMPGLALRCFAVVGTCFALPCHARICPALLCFSLRCWNHSCLALQCLDLPGLAQRRPEAVLQIRGVRGVRGARGARGSSCE